MKNIIKGERYYMGQDLGQKKGALEIRPCREEDLDELMLLQERICN